ncbi:MAG: hypothetical protein ABIN89_22870 [Chitinophagaceae bacterium]
MKIYLFRKTVYNCKQATMLALKKEENKISLFERMKLAYHLHYCDPCKRFIKQSEIINNAGKKFNDYFYKSPPYTLEEEKITEIREQLKALDK